MSSLPRTTGPDTNQPVPASRSLWRNYDFLLLWSGQAISSAGAQVSQLALPLLVLAITGSPVQAGLMGAVRGLPFVIFALPAGAFIDRWDRKRAMILSDSGRALALGSIPIALSLGHLTLAQLYLVSLVEGTLFTVFNVAESACWPRVVPKEQLPAALGQTQVVYATSTMVGPALAGALYGLSAGLPFLADAISYAASVISLFFIRAKLQGERDRSRDYESTPERSPARALRGEIVEGLAWLWRQPVVRALALLTGGLMTFSAGYILIVIELAQRLHTSAAGIGLIFATGGAGGIIGALIASPILKRFGFGKTIVAATWIWAVGWVPFAFAPDAVALAAINAIGWIIVPVYIVAQYSYRLALIPDHLLGRVNSVFKLVAFGSEPIGLALAGFLLQTVGPISTVFIIFTPQLLLAVAVTLSRTIRHAPDLTHANLPHRQSAST